MRALVKDGVIFTDTKAHISFYPYREEKMSNGERAGIISTFYSDKIARANGFSYVEQFVKDRDGKEFELDISLKIKSGE